MRWRRPGSRHAGDRADFGTASTFDASPPTGLRGGPCPGLELGLEALAARTAKLPRVDLRAPDRAIGQDTVAAIQSGAVLGHIALANGLIAGADDRRGRRTRRGRPGRLTGGLSAAPWREDRGRRRDRSRPHAEGPRDPPPRSPAASRSSRAVVKPDRV
jgi:hypothetical protein